MALIEFMIAGVQKCGTTSLDGYFRGHDQIQMTSAKETHFFDREESVNWRTPDYRALEGLFDPRRGGMRGDATPITLYWTPAHYRIQAYNPLMKFIIMVRPPADRAFSHWKMNCKNGLEPLPFSEAIRSGRLRVLDGGGPRVRHGSGPSGLHRIFSYVERGFYGRQIEQLGSLFGMEQILVVRQSDLLIDHGTVLDRVAKFLNIDPFAVTSPIRMNVADDDGAVMERSDRAYLDEIFAEDLDFLRSITGITLDSCADPKDISDAYGRA